MSFENEAYFFKAYDLMLSNTSDPWYGSGDSGFRSALFAAILGDHSMLEKCFEMIQDRRRWPVECDHMPHPRKNKLTRDPIVTSLFAAKMMDRQDLIDKLRVPIRLQRPDFYLWVRHLKTGRWLKLYELIAVVPRPAYARFLTALMAYTVQSDKIQYKVLRKTPYWNDIVFALCGGYDYAGDVVKSYVMDVNPPQEGFSAQSETKVEGRLLPADCKYALDRDFLTYILNQ